jgi:hypothetical protein
MRADSASPISMSVRPDFLSARNPFEPIKLSKVLADTLSGHSLNTVRGGQTDTSFPPLGGSVRMSSVRREQKEKSGAPRMKSRVIVAFPSGARNKGRRNRKSKLREITEKLKAKY